MSRKVIKLTESQLKRIIKEKLSQRVISENVEKDGEFTTIHRDDGKIVIVSDKVYDHIGTHAKPGKGSVFGGNITPDMINDKLMSENIPKTGGGIPVDFGSSNGYLLVAPIEVAMQFRDATIRPGSKEDFDPETKKMVPVPVAEVHTSQPITDFTADVATMLVFPYDPRRAVPEQNEFVENDEELLAAKEAGKLYALATAFPGGFKLKKVGGIPVPKERQEEQEEEGGVPKATKWGGVDDPSWAVIIPDSGLKKEHKIMKTVKLTKAQLKRIIKEGLEVTLAEAKLKDYITSKKIHSSIPAGSLMRVLMDRPDLRDQARNATDPAGQKEAFEEIAAALAQDLDIKRAIGDDPLKNHLDVNGFLRYAERNMPYLWT